MTGPGLKSIQPFQSDLMGGVNRGSNFQPGLHSPGGRFQRGQELIEFALTFPLFLLFIYGIVEMGRFFHVMIAISNAAREGARYGMAYGINRGVGNVYTLDENVVDSAAVKEAGNFDLKLTASQVAASCIPSTCVPGGRLRIVVNYTFRPMTDMIFPRAGINLEQDMEMVVP